MTKQSPSTLKISKQINCLQIINMEKKQLILNNIQSKKYDNNFKCIS